MCCSSQIERSVFIFTPPPLVYYVVSELSDDLFLSRPLIDLGRRSLFFAVTVSENERRRTVLLRYIYLYVCEAPSLKHLHVSAPVAFYVCSPFRKIESPTGTHTHTVVIE